MGFQLHLIVAFLLIVSVALNVLLLTRRRGPERARSVRTAVMDAIRNVSELATVRARFLSRIDFRGALDIPILRHLPGTTRKLLMCYSGDIVCGCDLSEVRISERFGVNRVRITIPHSRITHIAPDASSYEVYDQTNGLFNPIRLDDQNREVAADLETVRQHVMRDGVILKRADENVKRLLGAIMKSTGVDAEIVFRDEPEGVALIGERAEAIAEFRPSRCWTSPGSWSGPNPSRPQPSAQRTSRRTPKRTRTIFERAFKATGAPASGAPVL